MPDSELQEQSLRWSFWSHSSRCLPRKEMGQRERNDFGNPRHDWWWEPFQESRLKVPKRECLHALRANFHSRTTKVKRPSLNLTTRQASKSGLQRSKLKTMAALFSSSWPNRTCTGENFTDSNPVTKQKLIVIQKEKDCYEGVPTTSAKVWKDFNVDKAFDEAKLIIGIKKSLKITMRISDTLFVIVSLCAAAKADD